MIDVVSIYTELCWDHHIEIWLFGYVQYHVSCIVSLALLGSMMHGTCADGGETYLGGNDCGWIHGRSSCLAWTSCTAKY